MSAWTFSNINIRFINPKYQWALNPQYSYPKQEAIDGLSMMAKSHKTPHHTAPISISKGYKKRQPRHFQISTYLSSFLNINGLLSAKTHFQTKRPLIVFYGGQAMPTQISRQQ